MKKTFLLAALMLATVINAQVLNVASIQKLNTPQNSDTKVAGISPTGDYILLTSGANKGLTRFDLATGNTMTITEQEGAGYEVKISDNGNEVIYRETTYDKNHMRRNNILHMSFATRKRALVAQGQRDIKRMQFESRPTISINDRLMVLTQNDESTTLAPNGKDASYIWPSISPDGTKICYYVCGTGCYVCNIDGSNPQYIAHDCRAAKWYNNDIIIGMNDTDDGEFILSSQIVAFDLRGNSQVLTDDSMVAMYPYAIEGAVVFTTLQGETYLIHVNN
ncbi:MAG: hypothetical protein MJZ88_00140 [Paludibacteraceae bacterium]|nr:hypothetical protein [Paludibacteraceae bacterium]